MKLQQEMKQSHKKIFLHTQKMYQSLNLLKMNAMDIIEYVEEVVSENPMLEISYPSSSSKQFDDLLNIHF